MVKNMFDMKQFLSAINQIAEEKGIPKDKVVETVEKAIAAAYKKDYGEKGQIIRAKLDGETGKIELKQVKYVVEGVDEEGYLTGELPNREEDQFQSRMDREEEMKEKEKELQEKSREKAEGKNKKEDIKEEKPEKKEPEPEPEEGEELKTKYNPEKHVLLEEAKEKDKKLKVGDELVIPLETKTDFGRVAAQTAKQVIIQQIREVERGVIYEEFKDKEGEVISGTVQRKEGIVTFIDLGKTNGVLLPIEQIPNDDYRIGQRLRFLILRVEETTKGPTVILSRSHPKLILKLFELEVPEIESGSVEIKAVAREAGSRSKVAVISNEESVDPIGSLVGQKGVRVQTVINELSGEKIDIIEWSEDVSKFITNSLSPAKILNIKILSEEAKHALVEVADDQFSLAIGKKGQNVRLAAKLTGWKIDVRSPKEKLSGEGVEDKKDSKDTEEKPEEQKKEEDKKETKKEKKPKKEKESPKEEKAKGKDKEKPDKKEENKKDDN